MAASNLPRRIVKETQRLLAEPGEHRGLLSRHAYVMFSKLSTLSAPHSSAVRGACGIRHRPHPAFPDGPAVLTEAPSFVTCRRVLQLLGVGISQH